MSLIASINIGNETTTQAYVNCRLPGGVHIALLPSHSLGTQTFSGLDMGGSQTEFTLRCMVPPSDQQPSPGPYDLTVGWATLTVIPASSAEIAMGH